MCGGPLAGVLFWWHKVACAWDVLHPESKQQTTPAAPHDALECVAALARTGEDRQNCVRFAYLGPQVDRLHVHRDQVIRHSWENPASRGTEVHK